MQSSNHWVVGNMWESTTYRAIYVEGMVQGIAEVNGLPTSLSERDAVLLVGTHRFGEPDDHIRSRLAQIESTTQIHWLVLLVFDAFSWTHLLDNLPSGMDMPVGWSKRYGFNPAPPDDDFDDWLMERLDHWEESGKYSAIVEQIKALGIPVGEVRGKRDVILRIGSKKFGEPDASIRSVLNQIDSSGRLDWIADHMLDATTWNDLMTQ
ncbi:MAG: hypothetical protein ACLQVD_14745 [Capsulimonadaceae bacterium]